MDNKYLDEYNKTINMLLSVEKGRKEVINDIIKILYDAHLTDKEALIEIMKYCGVYNGGNNDE